MKKRIFYLIIPIISFISCNNDADTSQTPEKVKIKITEVEEVIYVKKIRASGILSSKEEKKLSFKTGGIVEKINFNEGEFFKKGDVIATLNLREINAKVDQAKLSVEKANRDLQRVENLYRDSVATREQLQNAQTAFDYAKANLEIAQFNKEYSRIIAISDGKVLKRVVEENELVASGHPVVLISSDEKDWVVRTNIADVDIVKVQLNDTAIINFDAFRNKSIRGIITEIAGKADPYTGTFEIEITLLHPPKELISGMIAKINIWSSKKEKLLKVPVDAIIEGNELTAYIYILDNEKVQKKQIEIDEIQDQFIFVRSGIVKGQRVVIEGVNYINPDTKIEIVE